MGKVSASLETSHYRGPIAKGITVSSNDPAASVVQLELTAEVVSAIEVLPTDMPSLRTRAGEGTPIELTVQTADGKPFTILTVKADASVGVTVKPAPGVPVARPTGKARTAHPVATGSSRYLVTITPAKDAPAGQFFSTVTLTTDVPKAETVPIQASVLVMGQLQLLPPRLLVQPTAQLPLHVKIRRVEGDGLKILAATSTDPDFTATATPVTEGREYDVTVAYTGKPDRGPVNARIIVTTNQPGEVTVVIPLMGRI